MKIAFCGAGPRAQPYLQALAHRPDVMVTEVCDPDQRAAEVTAAGWGAKVHRSYETMLQDGCPDALWICVAAPLQAGVIAKATELNIPFFIEPPGAVDFDHARAYRRRIARSKLVTAVGFTHHSIDVVREAREYLGTNPVPVALAWWLNRGENDESGGATQLLWTETCRLVDALRLFCGQVERVRALAAPSHLPSPVMKGGEGKGEGAAGGLVAQLEFTGGGVGVLTCANFARPEPRRELEFMGDGWSFSFGEGFATLRVSERDKTTILRCLNDPTGEQVTAFLAAVEASDPGAVAVSYDDALHTLAVCHAAALSVREARPVRITEVEQPDSHTSTEIDGSR